MFKSAFYALSGLLCFSVVQAQEFSRIVVDSASKAPLAYASVEFNGQGTITNGEGYFKLLLEADDTPSDSLFISSIGYAEGNGPLSQFPADTIYLPPKAISLDGVIVSNKNYSAEEVLEQVRERLSENYRYGPTKRRLFFRESYRNSIDKTDYTIKTSTIPELNRSFLDSMLRAVPKRDAYYAAMLGDMYGVAHEDDQKLKMIKAAEMYDKATRVNYENLEERFNALIKKHVKTDSYFKVKSGLLGTKVAMDDVLDTPIDSSDTNALDKAIAAKKEAQELRKKNIAFFNNRALEGLFESLPIFKESDHNVLFKPNRYALRLEQFTYIGEQPLYVIDFVPKRSETYRGKLYINADDLAVVKVEFGNVEPLKDFSLFGVSFKEYLAKGSMHFDKDEKGKYHLRYLSVTKGEQVGFKRPIKIIEKNKHVKGRRKQNELSLDVDSNFSALNTFEVLVFSEETIGLETVEGVSDENDVLPVYLDHYDPDFWRGYAVMAPNAAIKAFSTLEREQRNGD